MVLKTDAKLCICEICTCGRHHCPHNPFQGAPFSECLVTEYESQFIPRTFEIAKPYRPLMKSTNSDEPFSSRTTHREDYVPFELEKSNHRPLETYKQPSGSMESDSVYKRDYIPLKSEPSVPIRPETFRPNLGKFDAEPTYRTDFPRWETETSRHEKNRREWNPPTEPFSGEASYRSDYIRHPIELAHSTRPIDSVQLSTREPFENVTDYRQSYVPHTFERQMPYKENHRWQQPVEPVEDLTTFRRDYTPKRGDKVESYRPPARSLLSREPLQSDTTMRSDYQPWLAERPVATHSSSYEPPSGEMDSTTTYLNDYHRHPLVIQASMRHQSRHPTANQPFEDNTNYRENFRGWEVTRPAKAGPKDEYVLPSTRFEGESTAHSHYVAYPFSTAGIVKPNRKPLSSTTPFEDGTIYRMDYTPKHVEVCPATLIDSPRSRYMFSELDTSGHRLYQPIHLVEPEA